MASPVATAFLHHLENFADDTAPSIATLDGQLWYDDGGVSTIPSLNIYDSGTTGNNGAGWNRIAHADVGTVESSTIRWNDTEKTWQEEERVRISDAGELLLAWDGTASNVVTVQHDGVDLNIVGTAGTVDINITSVTAVNMPSITLTTVLDETYGGTGLITYTTGDLLYASGANTLTKLGVGSNTEVLTLAGGVPTWASGGASGTVTSSGAPLNNEVAVFATATDINSDSTFTWDGTTMFATNVTGTNIGGIASANLVNKADTEVIAGAWSFTNVQPIVASAGDIDATNGFGFVTTDGPVAAAIRADNGTTQIQFTHSGTPDWNISGLGVILSASPIHATSISSSAAFRAIGDANTWSTADSFISFYDSDNVEHGLQIGTLAGSSLSIVNARLGQLELWASNTEVVNFQPSLAIFTSASITSLELRNSFTSGNTTSAAVTDNNDNQHNVGYNETPLADDLGANINTGSFTLSNLSIGKFISRTTGTSRTLTIDNVINIPVGASVLVHNGHTGGTLTIAIGTITNLNWIDGSGSLPSAIVNRTLAYNSICTLRKVSATDWQIWGNGIS